MPCYLVHIIARGGIIVEREFDSKYIIDNIYSILSIYGYCSDCEDSVFESYLTMVEDGMDFEKMLDTFIEKGIIKDWSDLHF